MSRSLTKQQLAVIGAAVFGVVFGFGLLRATAGPGGGEVETAGGESAIVSSGGRAFDNLSLASPAGQLPVAASSALSLSRDVAEESAEADEGSDEDEAPAPRQDEGPKEPERYRSPSLEYGYEIHAFLDHAVPLLGPQMLAPGQQAAGGYTVLSPRYIAAQSTITGLRPVIEQAIDDVRRKDPNVTGIDLERKVANRLTQLNDWKNLNRETQEKMMILSEVDIQNLDKGLREKTVNHVLHSPLPFGDIEEVLHPETTIDMGYTHTLDKKWTEVAHLGDGVFQVTMISNNNNGSHTGHVLGRFKVQLTPYTSLIEARQIANNMVDNDNNNNKLYLDETAKAVLYGSIERLDFSGLTAEERRQSYIGKALGDALEQREEARRAAEAEAKAAEEAAQVPIEEPPAEEPAAEEPPAEEPPADTGTDPAPGDEPADPGAEETPPATEPEPTPPADGGAGT